MSRVVGNAIGQLLKKHKGGKIQVQIQNKNANTNTDTNTNINMNTNTNTNTNTNSHIQIQIQTQKGLRSQILTFFQKIKVSTKTAISLEPLDLHPLNTTQIEALGVLDLKNTSGGL